MRTIKNRFLIIFITVVVCIIVATSITLFCTNFYIKTVGSDYDLVQIDLASRANFVSNSKYNYLYDYTIVDDNADYLAHPDSILINNKLTTMYVYGHGKGSILTKTSVDMGETYSDRLTTTPETWTKSEETPTLFTLNFINGTTKYIMVSANPKWTKLTGDGFNASISEDGETWSEFQKYYGKGSSCHVSPIVAMASLVQLKENGSFVDKWMGVFHDDTFKNYKSILTFDENGEMQWSEPVQYFKGLTKNYYSIAKKTQMCEVMVIRSDEGNGNQLCLITRSNTKMCNSLISFSDDEGETWSEPKEIFAALNGERLKGNYTKDGRLIITFRSIERDSTKLNAYYEGSKNWYSEGWIMWVGNYQDLVDWYNGDTNSQGQYRVKIAHTYLENQTKPEVSANADTGYCGTVIFEDGTIVTTSYGCFAPDNLNSEGKHKTYIVSKRLILSDLDEINNIYKNNL